AKANLTALCATYLPGQYEVEIVDVFKQPERALKDGVLMTPTLLKVVPAPAQRIVGTLDQTESVIVALGLEAIPCSKPSTA
ncbi:MAG: circadian clock KaiB family protein, partial [Bryobacteraceae bacterium]